MARRLFFTSIVAAILVAGAPPATAQGPAVDVRVVQQPLWHVAGDRLDISLRLTNSSSEPIPGYIVTVAAHARVLSRSALHESFETPVTFEASAITAIEAPDEEIAPGAQVTSTITQPVAELQSLAVATESGVYPLTISVFDGSGAVLGTTTTQLIYYPTPPEFSLTTVPIIPIADLPSRAPDGVFGDGADIRLVTALQPDGWLRGMLTELARATEPPQPRPSPRGRGRGREQPAPARTETLAAGVVVLPRLAEELADMADGYRSAAEDERVPAGSPSITRAVDALGTIEEILERPSVQPLLSPYSFPDLPTLFDSFDLTADQHLDGHLREAEAILQDTFGSAPDRDWIYTAGARLDTRSLEALQQQQAGEHTFFGAESLEPIGDLAGPGCPEPPLSFTCPVSVTTTLGESTGFVLDDDLQRRISEVARGDGGREAIQRFFAETVAIREEVPSRVDRVLAIALPGAWEPPRWTSRLLFNGLRRAPWLQTMTPERALASMREQEVIRDRRIRSSLPRLANEPDTNYRAEVQRAEVVVEALRAIQPPGALVQRLARNALVAESRLWWSDPTTASDGESYASQAADEAERELGKITIGGSDEIGLTSREAEIPIVVFNDAAYEVSVTVVVRSAALGIDEQTATTIGAHGLKTITLDVQTQSSGIFTAFVRVETPDGYDIDSKTISVRSTEFNEIALGLTFGALAFLILFYITRAIRMRQTRAPEPGE